MRARLRAAALRGATFAGRALVRLPGIAAFVCAVAGAFILAGAGWALLVAAGMLLLVDHGMP